MRGWALAAVFLSTAAMGAEPVAPCPAYAPAPQKVGVVPAPLAELSGMVASRLHPGIFWAHNDSGNAFELFAVTADGSVKARRPIEGVGALDAEDIAAGPCPREPFKSCLFVGDIGDNFRKREKVFIYQLEEPAALEGEPLTATALPFRYPEGPHNAEALLADPKTGRLYVLTKSTKDLGTFYRLDDLEGPLGGLAVKLNTLEGGVLATAADIHPSGTRVLVRSYSKAYELHAPEAKTLEEVLAAPLVEVPFAPQPQSESACYTQDGRGYLLGTEGGQQALFRVDCKTKVQLSK